MYIGPAQQSTSDNGLMAVAFSFPNNFPTNNVTLCPSLARQFNLTPSLAPFPSHYRLETTQGQLKFRTTCFTHSIMQLFWSFLKNFDGRLWYFNLQTSNFLGNWCILCRHNIYKLVLAACQKDPPAIFHPILFYSFKPSRLLLHQEFIRKFIRKFVK